MHARQVLFYWAATPVLFFTFKHRGAHVKMAFTYHIPRFRLRGCIVLGVKKGILFPYSEPYNLEGNIMPLFHNGETPGE